MLVLSRFVEEEIIIGDNIIIKVVEVRGGKVRLGIEAPETVAVDRMEIRRRSNYRSHYRGPRSDGADA